jgi:hypothetical protein
MYVKVKHSPDRLGEGGKICLSIDERRLADINDQVDARRWNNRDYAEVSERLQGGAADNSCGTSM